MDSKSAVDRAKILATRRLNVLTDALGRKEITLARWEFKAAGLISGIMCVVGATECGGPDEMRKRDRDALQKRIEHTLISLREETIAYSCGECTARALCHRAVTLSGAKLIHRKAAAGGRG